MMWGSLLNLSVASQNIASKLRLGEPFDGKFIVSTIRNILGVCQAGKRVTRNCGGHFKGSGLLFGERESGAQAQRRRNGAREKRPSPNSRGNPADHTGFHFKTAFSTT